MAKKSNASFYGRLDKNGRRTAGGGPKGGMQPTKKFTYGKMGKGGRGAGTLGPKPKAARKSRAGGGGE